ERGGARPIPGISGPAKPPAAATAGLSSTGSGRTAGRPHRGSAPPRAGAGPEPDGWIRWGRGATTAGAGSLLGERLHDPLEHGLVAAGLALRDVQDQGETLVADDDPVDGHLPLRGRPGVVPQRPGHPGRLVVAAP